MSFITRLLVVGAVMFTGALVSADTPVADTTAAADSGAAKAAAVAEPVAGAASPETVERAPIALPAEHETFVRAISEQWVLQFNYGGHARVCEPHSYGIGSTGEAILHVYQTAGSSGSRPPPGWRTFTVSGITDLVLTQRRFARPRKDYSDQRPALDPAWAEVPAPAPEAGAAAGTESNATPATTTRTITLPR